MITIINQYMCKDGTIFNSKQEAEQYEKKLGEVRIYKVYAGADLIEGKHGPKYKGVILVNSPHYEVIARWWTESKYGSEYGFIQGIITEPQKRWFIEPIDRVYCVDDILARIEDYNPTEVIWGPGFTQVRAC